MCFVCSITYQLKRKDEKKVVTLFGVRTHFGCKQGVPETFYCFEVVECSKRDLFFESNPYMAAQNAVSIHESLVLGQFTIIIDKIMTDNSVRHNINYDRRVPRNFCVVDYLPLKRLRIDFVSTINITHTHTHIQERNKSYSACETDRFKRK